MSDGMSDAYRMEQEAREREEALKKDPDFDDDLEALVRSLSDSCRIYLGERHAHAARLTDPHENKDRRTDSKIRLQVRRDGLSFLCESVARRLREGKL